MTVMASYGRAVGMAGSAANLPTNMDSVALNVAHI